MDISLAEVLNKIRKFDEKFCKMFMITPIADDQFRISRYDGKPVQDLSKKQLVFFILTFTEKMSNSEEVVFPSKFDAKEIQKCENGSMVVTIFDVETVKRNKDINISLEELDAKLATIFDPKTANLDPDMIEAMDGLMAMCDSAETSKMKIKKPDECIPNK
jgi:hypothetical protein